MKRGSRLIIGLLVLHNICISQQMTDNSIILYGTVDEVSETDVILRDIKVLTNNYNENNIRIYALMLNGPSWIRPDSSWIGKKAFAVTRKNQDGVFTVNNYHPIMGQKLSLTPNLSEFFVFDSIFLSGLSISGDPEYVFLAIKNFHDIIQISDCKQRADALFNVVNDTSKYNFLREYAVYILYHYYSSGECMYVNPFRIMKKTMNDISLETFLRERSYYLLKSNNYPLEWL